MAGAGAGGVGSAEAGADTLRIPADARIPRMTMLARRIAMSKGLDVSGIQGSGVSGRVYSSDLAGAPSQGGDRVQGSSVTALGPQGPQGGASVQEPQDGSGGALIRMNGMRRVIAKRMAQSSSETATVSQFVEVDVTKLLAVRKRLNEGKEKKDQVTVTAFILKAMAIATKEHERFRMQLGADGDSFILKDEVNIGVAVGTAEGLTVPVLRGADLKPIEAINSETADMAEKAREGKLGPDSFSGGVITLTNMGMFGVTAFTPIINQPEASILGTGMPTERLVMEDGVPKARSYMFQSLTYDHRIINGTESALFQKRVKELLEDPEKLL